MREASPSKRPDQLQADMKVGAVFRAGESYSERRTGFPGAPVPGQVKTMLPKTSLLESKTVHERGAKGDEPCQGVSWP